jgi:phosphate ABC transporter permease subunit PstA
MTVAAFDPAADPILARRREIQRIATTTVRRRHIGSRIAIGACWTCLGIAIIPLVAVLFYVIAKGLPAWSSTFFTQTEAASEGHGIKNAIVGTFVITALATAVTIPLGVIAGLFLADGDGKVAGAVRFTADVMTGVPSIVVGIFGYLAIVITVSPHFSPSGTSVYSGLAGAFAIGVIMLPVIMRAAETAIRGVPDSLFEAGLALGARRSTIARKVTLPSALPGLLTGLMLAVARGIGETAPLLLTIFGSQFLVWDPQKEMSAIPFVIYNDSSQPDPSIVQVAWGAALLLMVVVLVLNVGSRLLAAYLQRERR